jgi:hypothetical protein
MGDTVIHIAIYVKNENATSERNKYKEAYCVDDNDKDILFSAHLFPECVNDFAKANFTIIELLPSLLKSRLNDFIQEYAVPQHVLAKIQAIINYIERHIDIYVGIAVVYNECP